MNSYVTNTQVELRAVHTLMGKRYHIPSYQRGYRWNQKQVIDLLNDLSEFNKSEAIGAFYCLQPIVVAPLRGDQRPKRWQIGDEAVYEVIDGQQRLTTLLLILQYLRDKYLPLEQLYELSYETREESADFITNVQSKSEEEAGRNSDYWHIYYAYKAIEGWFTKNPLNLWPIYQLLVSGDDQKNVRIIWYEIGQSEDKIHVFSRLNIGKIPLTNAELIKALFLRQGNFADSPTSLEQAQLASEWDNIERKMRTPSFWSFVSGRADADDNDYANRIELIFNLIAGRKDNNQTSFDYYAKVLNAKDTHIKDIWLEIKQVFLRLKEWYENQELYHYVGYLTCTGSCISEIYELSREKSKRQFVQALKQKIKDGLKHIYLYELEYDTKSIETIRKVLLLFNIETILSSAKASMSFPFELYLSGSWDVEHIRSQTEYSNKRYQESLLRESVDYFESKAQLEEKEKKLLEQCQSLLQRMNDKQRGDAYQQDFENFFSEIQEHFGEDKDWEEINGLGNLTLLDSRTNRSYGNSPFVLKRQRIVQNDKRGIFTPIATKNVFLKYYSRHATDILVWQDKDAEDYMQAIQELLSDYFPNQQPE